MLAASKMKWKSARTEVEAEGRDSVVEFVEVVRLTREMVGWRLLKLETKRGKSTVHVVV